ncbi:MAG: hypothetical protein H6867_04585 [Rhodospirillales bacterium]|nr:hypothetical protein [Rhodospirillales bacterium]MCB9996427.1 hypothetical protein [Rhodospirillales bacterium]
MSDKETPKKGDCCKGFEDSACPCLDEKTGERNCGTDKGNDKGGCCDNDKGGCCTPKPK